MELKEKLKSIFLDTECHIMFNHDDFAFTQAMKSYATHGFRLDSEMIDLIRVFKNRELEIYSNNRRNTLRFKTERVIEEYTERMEEGLYDQFIKEEWIPFAELYGGYVVLVKDRAGKVLGLYEDLIIHYGSDIWSALDNILKGREIARMKI